MQELEPPDSYHLSAAMGWVELGNAREAAAEFEKIRKEFCGHMQVLEAEWRIATANKDWDGALTVARKQVKGHADSPAGWINQSYCLHELKRTQEAWDYLWSVAEQFSQIGVLHYNLACYACQLGQLEVAKKCLNLAIQCQNKKEIKKMALADKDLKSLADYIRTL